MENMNKEEKQAIETLKSILKYWQTIVDIEDDIEREIEMSMYCEEMPFNEIKILLNYIDKLQKENENALILIEQYSNEREKILKGEFISKDKIRAKIKELEKEMNREDIQEEHFWCVEAERSVLVELLGDDE